MFLRVVQQMKLIKNRSSDHRQHKHTKERKCAGQTNNQAGRPVVSCTLLASAVLANTVLPSEAVNWVGKFHPRNNSSIASGIQWNNPLQQRLNNFMTDWLDHRKQKWSDPLSASNGPGIVRVGFLQYQESFPPIRRVKNPIRLSRTVECTDRDVPHALGQWSWWVCQLVRHHRGKCVINDAHRSIVYYISGRPSFLDKPGENPGEPFGALKGTVVRYYPQRRAQGRLHCNVDPLRTPSWPAIHNNEEDCLQDILRLFELNEFYLQINKTPLHTQHPSDGSSPLVEQNKTKLSSWGVYLPSKVIPDCAPSLLLLVLPTSWPPHR